PGASVSYSGSYTPSGDLCGPFTNTVTATGTDACKNQPISKQASVTCPTTISPCIDVTKECDGAPFAIGKPIKFKGFVTNCGDVSLNGVVVVDVKARYVFGALPI